jgi:hypothetical protein
MQVSKTVRTVKVPIAWKPDWAPAHIDATYTLPADEDPEDPVRVQCVCNSCGAHWQTDCYSRRHLTHIQRFCQTHLHR